MLVENDNGTTFGAGPPEDMSFATVWHRNGRWERGPAGDCPLRPYREGFETAMWLPEADHAGATTLAVVVIEGACADGKPPGDRLQPVERFETAEAVTLTFWVRSQTGAHRCPGNPPTRVEVELDDPLGDRVLLDGGRFPAQPAVRPDASTPTTASEQSPGGSSTIVEDPPADPDAARAAIDETFHQAFDADVPEEERYAAVEDGPGIREAGHEAASKFPEAAASISVEVHTVQFRSPTRAAVRFELLYRGAALLGQQDGEAVLVDGRWKVSRDTRCAIIRQAGVVCPNDA